MQLRFDCIILPIKHSLISWHTWSLPHSLYLSLSLILLLAWEVLRAAHPASFVHRTGLELATEKEAHPWCVHASFACLVRKSSVCSRTWRSHSRSRSRSPTHSLNLTCSTQHAALHPDPCSSCRVKLQWGQSCSVSAWAAQVSGRAAAVTCRCCCRLASFKDGLQLSVCRFVREVKNEFTCKLHKVYLLILLWRRGL